MVRTLFFLFSMIVVLAGLTSETMDAQDAQYKESVSFKDDVFPIIQRACLPCHAEDNFNPSELSLDSRELLIAGGKHGVAVLPGKPEESILFQKISPGPPFGDRMPLDPKKRKGEPSRKSLTDEEINLIRDWIAQGAKEN